MSTTSIGSRPSISLPSTSTQQPNPSKRSHQKLIDYLIEVDPNLAAGFLHCAEEYDGLTIKQHALMMIDSFTRDFYPRPETTHIIENTGLTLSQFITFLTLVDIGLKRASHEIPQPGRLRNIYSHTYIFSVFTRYKQFFKLQDTSTPFSFLFSEGSFNEYIELENPSDKDETAAACMLLIQAQRFGNPPLPFFAIFSLFQQIKWASCPRTRGIYFELDPHATTSLAQVTVPKLIGLRPFYQERIQGLNEKLIQITGVFSQETASLTHQELPKKTKTEQHRAKMAYMPYRVYYLWKKGFFSFPQLADPSENASKNDLSRIKVVLMHAADSSISVHHTLKALSPITCLYPTTTATLALMRARGNFVLERLGDSLKAEIPPMTCINRNYLGFSDINLWNIHLYSIDKLNRLLNSNPTRPFIPFKALQAVNPFLKIIPHNRIDLHHFLCLLSTWKKLKPAEFDKILSPGMPRTQLMLIAVDLLRKGFQNPQDPLLDHLHQDPLACTSCDPNHNDSTTMVLILDELKRLLNGFDKERIILSEITRKQLIQLKRDLTSPYRHLSSELTWMYTATTLRQLKQWNAQLFQTQIQGPFLTEWLSEIDRERALQRERIETALRLIQHPFTEHEVALIKGKLHTTFDIENEQDSRFFANLNLIYRSPLKSLISHTMREPIEPPSFTFSNSPPRHTRGVLRFYRHYSHLWPHLLKKILREKLRHIQAPSPNNEEFQMNWSNALNQELLCLEETYQYLRSSLLEEQPRFPLNLPEIRKHIESPTSLILASRHLIPQSIHQKLSLSRPTALSKHAWDVVLVKNGEDEAIVRSLLPESLQEEMTFYHTKNFNTGGIPLVHSPEQREYVECSSLSH